MRLLCRIGWHRPQQVRAGWVCEFGWVRRYECARDGCAAFWLSVNYRPRVRQ